jgi:hypothetical protein
MGAFGSKTQEQQAPAAVAEIPSSSPFGTSTPSMGGKKTRRGGKKNGKKGKKGKTGRSRPKH